MHWGQREGRGAPEGAWAPLKPQRERQKPANAVPEEPARGNLFQRGGRGHQTLGLLTPPPVGGALAPPPPRTTPRNRFLPALALRRVGSDLCSLSQRGHRESRLGVQPSPGEAGGGGLWTGGLLQVSESRKPQSQDPQRALPGRVWNRSLVTPNPRSFSYPALKVGSADQQPPWGLARNAEPQAPPRLLASFKP